MMPIRFLQQSAAGPVQEAWAWLRRQTFIEEVTGLLILIAVAVVIDLVAKRVILRIVKRLVEKSTARWDDLFASHGAFDRLAHLAPAIAVYYGIDLVPQLSDQLTMILQRGAGVAAIFLAALAGDAALRAVNQLLLESPLGRHKPVTAYIQIAQIALYVLAAIVGIATAFGQNPLLFLSGIGAATAVLMLIFRDTILSFVSSIQISSYDMVRLGDWIVMPEYGADGDVVRIDLLTVRVQNWDKTVTTIPTYKLTQGSFKNWRAMSEAGGRRIKRSVLVDLRTVRFLDEEDMARFETYDLLTDYIRRKRDELTRYNTEHVITKDVTSNVRRLTNLGTFRAYLQAYLARHPKIHTEGFTFMVRQLDPTPTGVPLQIYAFTTETAWVAYEGIQADIFDHVFAIAPDFDLALFQAPSGRDVAAIGAVEGGRGR